MHVTLLEKERNGALQVLDDSIPPVRKPSDMLEVMSTGMEPYDATQAPGGAMSVSRTDGQGLTAKDLWSILEGVRLTMQQDSIGGRILSLLPWYVMAGNLPTTLVPGKPMLLPIDLQAEDDLKWPHKWNEGGTRDPRSPAVSICAEN